MSGWATVRYVPAMRRSRCCCAERDGAGWSTSIYDPTGGRASYRSVPRRGSVPRRVPHGRCELRSERLAADLPVPAAALEGRPAPWLVLHATVWCHPDLVATETRQLGLPVASQSFSPAQPS
jgi:hypothetical protein